MRIGTKSLLGCRSSRLVSGLITSWALDLHHPTLGCADSQTQRLLRHPAFPLVHQLFSVRPLDNFYYDLLFISALQIICWELSPWNTRLLLLVLFIDAGLGMTSGGKLGSSSWGKETYVSPDLLQPWSWGGQSTASLLIQLIHQQLPQVSQLDVTIAVTIYFQGCLADCFREFPHFNFCRICCLWHFGHACKGKYNYFSLQPVIIKWFAVRVNATAAI